jgi:hypothetical protein
MTTLTLFAARVTDETGVIGAKEAVTSLAMFMVVVHVALFPAHAPAQLVNIWPVPGSAARVTTVPSP